MSIAINNLIRISRRPGFMVVFAEYGSAGVAASPVPGFRGNA